MSKKDEIWKKVKMKEHYHGKIHIVEKDENGNEHDTGLFICSGMNLVPDFSGLTQKEMELLTKE